MCRTYDSAETMALFMQKSFARQALKPWSMKPRVPCMALTSRKEQKPRKTLAERIAYMKNRFNFVT